MLLVVDIGNTNTNLGVFSDDNKLKSSWNISSDIKRFEDEYGILILSLLQNSNITQHINGAIISSVVAPLTQTYKKALKKYLNIDAFVLSHKAKLPVNIDLEQPKEAGADRLANASAAAVYYKLPAIVIDLGTATSFDIVDKDRNFIGGLIAPGLKIQAKSLSQFTSKLPKLKIEAPKNAIGKDTISAMLSGIVRGHAAMIDGMVKACEKELGERATVIATGGYSSVLFDNMERGFDYINPNLTLEGLKYLYGINCGEVENDRQNYTEGTKTASLL
ncbi:TPA: type III pantothenate kinase [Candidatus Galligastranaerophilus intestinavium]|uniref:Type III pantothenate kinase n=1 Tax=Candidatus Galligastranaerophilus intestinavium TaxID=2840836 RepID=A0A9D1FJM1_9BACT|nr:type III pantothenate kinase [Candidatus Galligastranaerophilus intestinavium]